MVDVTSDARPCWPPCGGTAAWCWWATRTSCPSVGPGNLFSDLIRSGTVPTVRLTEIFRQAAQSAIVRNAHVVNRGQLPDLRNNEQRLLLPPPPGPAQSAAETIVELVPTGACPNGWASRRTRSRCSPPPGRRTDGHRRPEPGPPGGAESALDGEGRSGASATFIFREGDRVMQVKNNYDILWREDGGAGLRHGDVQRGHRPDRVAWTTAGRVHHRGL